MFKTDIANTINFVRDTYSEPKEFIPLHEPRFWGNEKDYVMKTIDSTFVSSVGQYVTDIEIELAKFCGAKRTVAVVNGTAALHIALKVMGVERDDLVLTQALTFIATCNAVSYLGAQPVFLDVDRDSLNISPEKLELFLEKHTVQQDGYCYYKKTMQKIPAIVVMHTFGHMAQMDRINEICQQYNIKVIEDAAEALGSRFKGRHAGTWGDIGIYSFNGNKVMTTGGGGALIVNDNEKLADHIKHLTTTAKLKHKWEFRHDEVGYNYRMPNLNAALGCAQLENLNFFIEQKRKLASVYQTFFSKIESISFFTELEDRKSNYWFNTLVMRDKDQRDDFLKLTNESGVMTRPIWELMNTLNMFKDCFCDNLENSIWLSERIVNIPSSVIRNL